MTRCDGKDRAMQSFARVKTSDTLFNENKKTKTVKLSYDKIDVIKKYSCKLKVCFFDKSATP